nr:hypothetical protein Iba_chr14aCG11090 [Ipomoea batatas]
MSIRFVGRDLPSENDEHPKVCRLQMKRSSRLSITCAPKHRLPIDTAKLVEHLKLFLNDENTISTNALVTREALDEVGCKRGPSPPPRVIVTEVMEVSSREEDDSEDDLGELRESPSPRSTSHSELHDMAEPQKSCADIVCRLRNIGKKPRTGESSRAPPDIPCSILA